MAKVRRRMDSKDKVNVKVKGERVKVKVGDVTSSKKCNPLYPFYFIL